MLRLFEPGARVKVSAAHFGLKCVMESVMAFIFIPILSSVILYFLLHSDGVECLYSVYEGCIKGETVVLSY